MSDYIRENKADLQDHFQAIASKALEILPEDWTSAALGYFLVGEDRTEQQQLLVRCSSSKELRDVMKEAWDDFDMQDILIDILEEFRKMHEVCAKAEDDWCEATMLLNRDGSFNMDYVYEPITVYDSFFILDWQSRHII